MPLSILCGVLAWSRFARNWLRHGETITLADTEPLYWNLEGKDSSDSRMAKHNLQFSLRMADVYLLDKLV